MPVLLRSTQATSSCFSAFVSDIRPVLVPQFHGGIFSGSTFLANSYIVYSSLGQSLRLQLVLEVNIRTHSTQSAVVVNGPGQQNGDFFALYLQQNVVVFSMQLGSGIITGNVGIGNRLCLLVAWWVARLVVCCQA